MRYFIYCRKSTESEERQVLSLQSQREALDRSFAGNDSVDIVDVFEESKSAKTPGRPVFAAMLARIEAGEADGIVSWAPDRLARNSIDGGLIVYLLDTGVLRDLKFSTYTFENNSQGKFMLQIMFGQSKYYSDALSDNVKRGNRSKLERGWRPNRAPLGYINDAASKTIVPDPQHFALVRQMFDMVLCGKYVPREIVRIAREEWGFLTPKCKRSGGKPLANSTIYKMLRNPFYKGIIEWDGVTYIGRHAPVVSADEFDRVQAILNKRATPHTRQLTFLYSGLIKCGACGKTVTAERKRNRHGSVYTYYHCSARSSARGHCRESSLEGRAVEAQVLDFLSRLRIHEKVANWVRAELVHLGSSDAEMRSAEARSRQAAIAEIDAQISELTSLRLRRLVDDEEYLATRNQLQARRLTIEKAVSARNPQTLIEPFELLVLASNQAVDWFKIANEEGKRALLKITCSNPLLKDKKLSIQAAKPFLVRSDLDECLRLRGVVDSDRENGVTSVPSAYAARKEGRAIIKALRAMNDNWVDNLTNVSQLFAPTPHPKVAKARARRRGRGSLRRTPRPDATVHHTRVHKRS